MTSVIPIGTFAFNIGLSILYISWEEDDVSGSDDNK